MPAKTLTSFSEVSAQYDAVLCDVWGVIHNGVRPFAPACDALQRYRAHGGRVLLVSNAPRPGGSVRQQLAHIGVPADIYDDVLTSGDVTRGLIGERAGEPLLHIGPERDMPLFAGLDAPRVPVSQARYIVCTGLMDDETETAQDYLPELTAAHALGLHMICANPDLVVDRGGRNIPCAGAIGAAYEALGGTVTYPGKPYRAIYDVAFERLGTILGNTPDLARLIGVGDAIRTDIAGAAGFGIASLMVLEGIHAHETAGLDEPEIMNWIGMQACQPSYVMHRLG
ncbi:MAG: TIGR01459 family HAD-type hydrolase [Bosea sp. (in: a-proteobacteria)]